MIASLSLHIEKAFAPNVMFMVFVPARVEVIILSPADVIPNANCTFSFGMNISEDQPPIGRLLKNNDIITFGNHQLQVILTPGHSHGSALFYCQSENVAFSNQHSECGVAFSGDTLFRMSIGRTDFAEGSWQDMERSLRTIATLLPPDTLILPGHGPQTTLSDELAHNPYMRF